MKNLTLSFFVAIIFSLFGVKTDAQVTYQPAPFWGELEVSATVGQLTKVMAYDFGTASYIRRVIVNSAPFGIPSYGDYSTIAFEGPLTGTGIDTVALNLPQSPNLGWRAWVVILDNNYEAVAPEVVLFNQRQPLAPLQISFPDPQYEYDGSLAARSISYNPTINSYFNPPDGENYTNIFNVRLFCSGPSGYDVTRSQDYNNFPTFQGFVANFNLPPDISGQWCLDAWVSVTHDSNTPKYWNGEKTQWSFYPPCFYWVDISTGVNGAQDEESLSAYPNPFNEVLAIKSPVVTEYQLVNIAGQVVLSGQLAPGGNIMQTSGLPAGAYILKTEFGTITKLIKQ